jgi:hypothetical protein
MQVVSVESFELLINNELPQVRLIGTPNMIKNGQRFHTSAFIVSKIINRDKAFCLVDYSGIEIAYPLVLKNRQLTCVLMEQDEPFGVLED